AAGYLFLACSGISSHGLDHVQQAVAAGAVAVAYDATTAITVPDIDVPLIAVDDLRGQLGDIANRFFDYPSRSVRVIGVTGTNGKTTVAWLLAQCMRRLGKPCGYVGTLGYGTAEIDEAEGMTTPDVIELHRRLAEFRDSGATCAAIEVSSHALAQQRIDGVQIDTALFTNLSRDHLDYHGDMRAYAEAKASLFLDAGPTRRIINMDSEFGTQLASRCGPDVVTVSTNFDRVANDRPYVFVRAVIAREDGFEVSVRSSWDNGSIWLPLPGEFNIANAVLVLAFLLSDGIPFDEASAALSKVVAPPGRLQRVDSAAGPAVFVDYAHTPNAIEVALRALRSHCRGKLWCVFGCGGDRDTGKRPLMGRAAERLADHIVVTSDNPRSEDAGDIITAIVDGLNDGQNATIIEDRAAAIAWAIRQAGASDVILLAGKGHENYQLIGDERRDFSDYGSAVANLLVRSRREEDDA
ncbi:MAG: UDP-N-acetylmuramoyl-L-alanyl-D-glutamate--2,6-diaminopimelate ligase, partial [Woeseiaceae bacterium]|nr:UDP-N-acetylmuramoyl-L-alanyl-D-glutamate--2,6-diaminopimelate ligase [Woeseiaceae bacterium]